jgi:hypothetical protein
MDRPQLSSDNDPVLADRKKAAELVKQWFDGSVTNYKIDDEWPYESKDRAVADIGKELWGHYSDSPEHELKPSYLSREEILLLKRCLAFLQSSERYTSVAYEEAVPWKPNLVTKLFGVKERPWETLRLNVPVERRDWWPFADQGQCEKVMGKSDEWRNIDWPEQPNRPRWLK